MHLPPAHDLAFSHDGAVVFCFACNHAGVTADAGVDVDRHAPSVSFIFEARIETLGRRFFLGHFADEIRILVVCVKSADSNQLTPFHELVELCAGERVLIARFADLDARTVPGSIRGAQCISVKSGAVSNPSRSRAAVSKVYCNAVVGLPR